MKTILIVEDDGDVLALLRELFGDEGWDVRSCCAGPQALRELARAVPDLVLLDLVLPGLDGTEVLARVRAQPQLARLPVVVMTASTVDGDGVPGADALVRKPFAADDLLRLAHDLTGGDARRDAPSLPT